MFKKFLTVLGLVILSQAAMANISISCGSEVNEDGEVKNERVSMSAESWIEGVSSKDFDLTVDGKEIKGARVIGESSSAGGIKIFIKIGRDIGGDVGQRIEIDAWEDLATTGRLVTVGGFAGGTKQELQCAVLEM